MMVQLNDVRDSGQYIVQCTFDRILLEKMAESKPKNFFAEQTKEP